jgi:hypothetical protein
MKVDISIGAPSLSGRGVTEEVENTIAGITFPCELHVLNHMPRAAVFPESGVELESVHAATGKCALVPFKTAAVLRRFLRSASEVAAINGYELAISVHSEAHDGLLDDELTQQIVEQHPEVAAEVVAAGGVDAAATLADTGSNDGNGEGDKASDTGDTNDSSSTPADGTNPEGGDQPATVTEPAATKAAGRKHQKK